MSADPSQLIESIVKDLLSGNAASVKVFKIGSAEISADGCGDANCKDCGGDDGLPAFIKSALTLIDKIAGDDPKLMSDVAELRQELSVAPQVKREICTEVAAFLDERLLQAKLAQAQAEHGKGPSLHHAKARVIQLTTLLTIFRGKAGLPA